MSANEPCFFREPSFSDVQLKTCPKSSLQRARKTLHESTSVVETDTSVYCKRIHNQISKSQWGPLILADLGRAGNDVTAADQDSDKFALNGKSASKAATSRRFVFLTALSSCLIKTGVIAAKRSPFICH